MFTPKICGSTDEALAERLYADLQAQGVRCWLAPHDLTPGEVIVRGITDRPEKNGIGALEGCDRVIRKRRTRLTDRYSADQSLVGFDLDRMDFGNGVQDAQRFACYFGPDAVTG